MKLIKFIIAVLTAPLLFSTGTFLWQVGEAGFASDNVPWVGLGILTLGFTVYVLIHFTLPRANWLYVFGHELTHALAAMLCLGRVSQVNVSSEEGYVVTTAANPFVTLAPYLIPFYPILLTVLWSLLLLIWPQLNEYSLLYLYFWGMSWGLHACFTIGLMQTDQSDFSSQGYFFSFVVIIFTNLWLVIALLWVILRPFGFLEGMSLWGSNVARDYLAIGSLFLWLWNQLALLLNL